MPITFLVFPLALNESFIALFLYNLSFNRCLLDISIQHWNNVSFEISSSKKAVTNYSRFKIEDILSDNIKLQDSKFYQKFSYVVRTGKNLSDWETAFDKLVHPAGFVFFGEILILTQLTRAALGDNIRQDLVELDIGIGEGSTGSIPVPNQPGFVYTYKDLYGRLNRKTLSSMPGVQPGVIGAEDVALLVEAFSSFFLPNAEGRISKSGQLSLTLNANGSITNVSVANPGFGYPIDQATKTIVNGQEFFDGPAITVTGDPIEGQGIGTALLTCKVDVDGRIDNVTIVSAGSNYASANASPDANSNNGKLTTIIKSGSEKHFATAPSIIISPPTATDADGVLLSSNVNATATVQISPSDVYYTAQEETNDLALEEGLRVGAVEGVGVTIPNESSNKPNKQQQRHHNGHNHITDLITQVHENRNYVVSLCQSQDTNHSFEHQHQQLIGSIPFMHVINYQPDSQLDNG